MADYNVNFTDDITKAPILMQEGVEDNTSLDISIFGNTFLEYGQELNENILHLLENFACPMNAGGLIGNATPDTINGSYNKLLSHPTAGQLWYNSSLKKLYYWDGTAWRPISNKNDVAANWGVMADGFQLPKPVSASSGYIFPYSECIWSVSPANFGGIFDYMECSTDTIATVNMKYRYAGAGTLTSGIANYLIIGIRGNTNTGIGFGQTPPAPSSTPTSTPIGTSTQTPTQTSTQTPTNTPTISQSASSGLTPTATRTPTPTPTQTQTPTVSLSSTSGPAPSQTPTPSLSSTGVPPPSPSSSSPPPTPTASPVYPLNIDSYGPNSLFLAGQCSHVGSGFHCTATTTEYGYVVASGGIPPYTYHWEFYGGSNAFVIDSPYNDVTLFRAGGVTPGVGGGSCDGCSLSNPSCPPDSENITCSQVRCKVTDSVSNEVYSPIFDLEFHFVNTS